MFPISTRTTSIWLSPRSSLCRICLRYPLPSPLAAPSIEHLRNNCSKLPLMTPFRIVSLIVHSNSPRFFRSPPKDAIETALLSAIPIRGLSLMNSPLRSLKVGRIPCHDELSMLSGTCLAPLSFNHGFIGNLLECLHIYNHSWLDNKFLYDALLDCSNLTDLKIVGLNFSPTEKILELVPRKCEHLYVECEIIAVRASFTNVALFARNCSNITSLSLIGFALQDSEASLLIESFRKLKYLDLSRTYEFDGSFLRPVELRCRDTLLETLILRDCITLENGPVLQFWNSLLEGNFRFIQHVDISNFAGLIVGGGSREYCTPKFSLDKLKEKRPGLTFVANFT